MYFVVSKEKNPKLRTTNQNDIPEADGPHNISCC